MFVFRYFYLFTLCLAHIEYIIQKYGDGKATPLEKGKIDNMYCTLNYFLASVTTILITFISSVTHYSEGTLMPLRVNGYVYSFISGQSPILMRPFVRMVTTQLTSQLVTPALKVNLRFVRFPQYHVL